MFNAKNLGILAEGMFALFTAGEGGGLGQAPGSTTSYLSRPGGISGRNGSCRCPHTLGTLLFVNSKICCVLFRPLVANHLGKEIRTKAVYGLRQIIGKNSDSLQIVANTGLLSGKS